MTRVARAVGSVALPLTPDGDLACSSSIPTPAHRGAACRANRGTHQWDMTMALTGAVSAQLLLGRLHDAGLARVATP